MQVIEQRDRLVDSLEEQRLKEKAEDQHFENFVFPRGCQLSRTWGGPIPGSKLYTAPFGGTYHAWNLSCTLLHYACKPEFSHAHNSSPGSFQRDEEDENTKTLDAAANVGWAVSGGVPGKWPTLFPSSDTEKWLSYDFCHLPSQFIELHTQNILRSCLFMTISLFAFFFFSRGWLVSKCQNSRNHLKIRLIFKLCFQRKKRNFEITDYTKQITSIAGANSIQGKFNLPGVFISLNRIYISNKSLIEHLSLNFIKEGKGNLTWTSCQQDC